MKKLSSFINFIGEISHSTLITVAILIGVPIITLYSGEGWLWGLFLGILLLLFYTPMYIAKVRRVGEGFFLLLLSLVAISSVVFSKWFLVLWVPILIYSIKKKYAILPNEFI